MQRLSVARMLLDNARQRLLSPRQKIGRIIAPRIIGVDEVLACTLQCFLDFALGVFAAGPDEDSHPQHKNSKPEWPRRHAAMAGLKGLQEHCSCHALMPISCAFPTPSPWRFRRASCRTARR